MLIVFLWLVLHCLSGSISIVLLGDRALISGNLLSWAGLIKLILSWKFYVSFALAFVSRFCFIQTNNALLKIPSLARNSTTITTFAAALMYVFVIVAAAIFLKERLNLQQGIGATIILIGIWVILH